MRPTSFALLTACLAAAACSAASADEDPRSISVTGQATLSLNPDTGRLNFSVVTDAPELDSARAQNAAAMRRVIQALQALRLPESRTTTAPDGTLQTSPGLALRTGNVNVEVLRSSRVRGRLPAIIGYRVSHWAVVRYHEDDPEKLADRMARMLDRVLKNGASHVGSVEFSLRDDGEAQEKALAAALANARHRAETLAREAGVRILRVRSIGEGMAGPYDLTRSSLMNQAALPATPATGPIPLVPGTLLFTGSVQATYEIE